MSGSGTLLTEGTGLGVFWAGGGDGEGSGVGSFGGGDGLFWGDGSGVGVRCLAWISKFISFSSSVDSCATVLNS